MTYYKCKCGKHEFFGSGMWPNDCEGCEECGTTMASNPDGHKPVAPHDWETKYDENTGKPYRRCKKCYVRKEIEKDEEDSAVICTECAFCMDDDCDCPVSKWFGQNVDGISVDCNWFKAK